MQRTLLLNPGPVTLTQRVRQALLQPDLCHREPEFAELTLDIKQRLIRVYPQATQDYEAVLLTGSGTCAVEAMLSSLIPREGKALVVANGVYGERIANMIFAHGKQLEIIASEWHEPMNLLEVEKRLQQDSAITHVVAVHHETTTGRLNEIAKLSQICRRYQIALLLDTVSSFGAEEIQFNEWNLEACAATANKCLHGVPGIAFVLVRRSVFDSRLSGAGSLYLDLYRYYREQMSGFSPFTQAVHVCYALQAALQELEEQGGWVQRREHYRTLSRKIFQGLQNLGIQSFFAESVSSCVLRSFKLPPGYTYEQIHDGLKAAGFIIYAGQGGLKSSIFRIANLGDIHGEDVENLLSCLAQLFNQETMMIV